MFTCSPGDAGWGPKCNHLVAKHAHKQRTIVCSDEAAFHFNVVVAGKTLVWFRWLAWLSDSTLKFSPALLNLISVLAGFGGQIVEITRHARVIWLPRVGGLPYFAAFTWRKLTPPKRVTRTGWPGNPPWWGTPPNMWTRSRKTERCMDRLVTPPGRGTSPAWGPSLPCEQALSKHREWLYFAFLIIFLLLACLVM